MSRAPTFSRRSLPSVDRLTNWQIAAIALYSLGGATARQHQEDVAVKCFELASRRFSWKRHDYPDIDRVGVALRDGKKVKNGALITGDKRVGWLLTPAGIDWSRDRMNLSVGDSDRALTAISAADERELRRLREHRLFGDWQTGSDMISVFLAADAVGLPADAPAHAIARRIAELEGAVRTSGQKEMEGFLEWLKRSLSAAS